MPLTPMASGTASAAGRSVQPASGDLHVREVVDDSFEAPAPEVHAEVQPDATDSGELRVVGVVAHDQAVADRKGVEVAQLEEEGVPEVAVLAGT